MPNTAAEPGRLQVVAGILCRGPQVLIARRPDHADQGGLWEFPGGKQEAGETPAAALARELAEELGIQVQQARAWFSLQHDYPGKPVALQFWWVEAFTGEPAGREGQPLRWVDRQ